MIEKSKKISDFIEQKHSTHGNLVLFHGQPGTGKTQYLKFLIKSHSSNSKKFIYLPNKVFQTIDMPSFIDFFSSHEDSILIIEDAESLLINRESGNASISTLLNLTEGLLGDALKLKVLCTFNCSISEIDPALQRKGRLFNSIEFKKLDKNLANKLFIKNGINKITEEDMTLADILNFEIDNGIDSEEKKLDFR